MTASIGVLIGVGFYFAAVIATTLTLGVLGLFRLIERRMPTNLFAQHGVRFKRSGVMPEPALRELLSQHGFSIANLRYRLEDGEAFEYRRVLRTTQADNMPRLATTLTGMDQVLEFRISPTGA